MDLKTLHTALGRLLEQGVEEDEPVCVEMDRRCFDLTSVSVTVESDLWNPNIVVLFTTEIKDDS